MRISLVHYSLPPTIGGVERIIAEQATALRSLGHEVALFTTCHADLASSDAILVHNVFSMPFNLPLTAALRALAETTPHIRWFNWLHDVAAVNPHYADLPWRTPELAQLNQPPANCTHIAVSEVTKQGYATATGLPLDAIQVVPNGVDTAAVLGLTTHVRLLASEYRLWERQLVLLHPARLVRRKNIHLGLRITAALRDLGLDVAYLVSGAPDPHNAEYAAYAQELADLVGTLRLEPHAHLLGAFGPLSEADIRCLYVLSDGLIFPSLTEGFGLPLIEATLHDLPIFCSDIPTHREVAPPTAHFFKLDTAPSSIAKDIAADATLLRRSARRAYYLTHDWSQVAVTHLLPLLQA